MRTLHLLFALVLLAQASNTAAAATDDAANHASNTAAAAADHDLPDVDLARDKDYLDHFRNFNYHVQAEPLLVKKLSHALKAEKKAVGQAVQEANEIASLTSEQAFPVLVEEALEFFVHPIKVDPSLSTIVRRAVLSTKNELLGTESNLANGLYNYEDEWSMDRRIAVMLTRGFEGNEINRNEFEKEMLNVLVRILQERNPFQGKAPNRKKRLIGLVTCATSKTRPKNRMEHLRSLMAELIDPVHLDTFEVLVQLQQARAAIQHDINEGPSTADSLMAKRLPGLLGIDKMVVHDAIVRARNQITFSNAVSQNRWYAVRRYAEVNGCRTEDFKTAIQRAIDANKVDVLETLLQHYALTSDFFAEFRTCASLQRALHTGELDMLKLLYPAVSSNLFEHLLRKAILAKNKGTLSFLLTDPRADQSAIAKASIGARFINIFESYSTLVKSGRITKLELESILMSEEKKEWARLELIVKESKTIHSRDD